MSNDAKTISRTERLAERLRENLHRRKVQVRQREACATGDHPPERD